EQVGDFAAVSFAPQVTVVRRVNQRDGDLQGVAAPDYPSGQQGVDVQSARYLPRVDFAVFITLYGDARFDVDVRQLREIVDDAVGDLVAEGGGVRSACGSAFRVTNGRMAIDSIV